MGLRPSTYILCLQPCTCSYITFVPFHATHVIACDAHANQATEFYMEMDALQNCTTYTPRKWVPICIWMLVHGLKEIMQLLSRAAYECLMMLHLEVTRQHATSGKYGDMASAVTNSSLCQEGFQKCSRLTWIVMGIFYRSMWCKICMGSLPSYITQTF